MTVAIVVPTFNRERLLELTIAAVQRQTSSDWTLIVVDDESTDETASLVKRLSKSDPRIRLVSQSHAGIAAARNRGLEALGDSDLVCFLDDDDLWEPDALQRLTSAIEGNPDAVGAYGLARRVGVDGEELPNDSLAERQLERKAVHGRRLITLPRGAPTAFEVMAFSNVIMTPGTVLIRRGALERAGRFREPAADWDMWLRLTMQGDLVFVPEFVIGYRAHPGNESQNILRNARRKLVVHWRLLWSAELARAQRWTAWWGFLHYYSDLARLRRSLRRISERVFTR